MLAADVVDSRAASTPAAAQSEPRGCILKLEGVRRRFGSVVALDGVDLSVDRGGIFGIIGRSGAGKSTLIRSINGLERIDAGRIVLNDVDLATLDEEGLNRVRRNVGMIFQHFNLLSMKTVFDNVDLPLKLAAWPRARREREVGRMLDLVGLSNKAKAYPAQLSGGQKQRVGIARALVSGPSLLLCDEATSALDPETTLSILRLLKDLNTTLGVTIILITHEMSVIREICDWVAVLDQGRVLEQGPVWQVFSEPSSELTRRLLRTVRPPLPDALRGELQSTPVVGGRQVLRIASASLNECAHVLPLLAGPVWQARIVHAEVDRIAAHAVGTVTFSICYRGAREQAELATRLYGLAAHFQVAGYVAG